MPDDASATPCGTRTSYAKRSHRSDGVGKTQKTTSSCCHQPPHKIQGSFGIQNVSRITDKMYKLYLKKTKLWLKAHGFLEMNSINPKIPPTGKRLCRGRDYVIAHNKPIS